MALRNVEERRRVLNLHSCRLVEKRESCVPRSCSTRGRFRVGMRRLNGSRRSGRVTLREGGEWQSDEILNADTKSGVGSWPSLRVQPVPREPESLMRLRCVLGVEMRI
jgi:hypothetical protein